MKRTIRGGVFETNSSSMHSIVLTKDNIADEKLLVENFASYLDKDNKLSIWQDDLEFGRGPFEILVTAERKLHYAIASVLSGYVHGHITEDGDCDDFLSAKLDEFDDLAKQLFLGCKGIKYPMHQVHDEKYVWEEPYLGYVDHASWGLLPRFLDQENVSLYEFISNPKYIVVIDGDEYCVFNTLKQSGLINRNSIVKEFE